MGVRFRVAEFFVDAVEHFFGEKVFEAFRLGVDLVRGKADLLIEVSFPEAVRTDHPQGEQLARIR